MRKIFMIFLTLFTSSLVFAGGGWVNQKGTGYAKLNQSIISASKFYNKSGESRDITTFRLYTTSVYADYGLNDKFTATVFAPFAVRPVLNREVSSITGAVVEEGDEAFANGDFTLGLKYGIVRNKPVVVAGSLNLGLPTGTTSGGRTELLQTGDGEFNQLLQLDVSSSAGPTFGGFKLGFNNRTNEFSDEFHYGAELGYNGKKVIVIGKWDGIKSFFNGDENAGTGGSIFSNNLEFNIVSVEVGYRITEKIGASGTYLQPLNGTNILDAPNLNFGLFYQFNTNDKTSNESI